MMETEKGKRIEQILATDVTREQLAEALWCAESSQRMWHGCAEENRSFRLRAEAENTKLRELVHDMFGAYERVVCLLPDSYLKSVSQRGAMDFRERIQELESEAIK